ncbi:MAG: MarR family transcriptional regulator [Phycisphaerales bacterium]|nr:MarR family transcriptional regulator [Phycisphaerales bacterium]
MPILYAVHVQHPNGRTTTYTSEHLPLMPAGLDDVGFLGCLVGTLRGMAEGLRLGGPVRGRMLLGMPACDSPNDPQFQHVLARARALLIRLGREPGPLTALGGSIVTADAADAAAAACEDALMVTDPVAANAADGLTDTQRRALAVIPAAPGWVTADALGDRLGITGQSFRSHVAPALKRRGLIRSSAAGYQRT